MKSGGSTKLCELSCCAMEDKVHLMAELLFFSPLTPGTVTSEYALMGFMLMNQLPVNSI